MHPFFLYEINRQHLADWERKAALQRMFMEDHRVARREPRRRRRFLAGAFHADRPRAGRAVATDACACR